MRSDTASGWWWYAFVKGARLVFGARSLSDAVEHVFEQTGVMLPVADVKGPFSSEARAKLGEVR